MQILNPDVQQDLDAGRPLRLDLGSGKLKKSGFYGLDIVAGEGVDVVGDLNEPLDLLPDDSVGELYTSHTLEHVTNLFGLLREIRRITRTGGPIEVIVPHFSNPYAHSDPTHVRVFGLYSMSYFVALEKQPGRQVPSHYSDIRFEIDSIEIEFYRDRRFDRWITAALSRFVNQSLARQDWYERRLSYLFPAWQIRYLLRPDK